MTGRTVLYIGAMVPLALYTRHCEVNHWSLEAVLLIVLLAKVLSVGLDNIDIIVLMSSILSLAAAG